MRDDVSRTTTHVPSVPTAACGWLFQPLFLLHFSCQSTEPGIRNTYSVPQLHMSWFPLMFFFVTRLLFLNPLCEGRSIFSAGIDDDDAGREKTRSSNENVNLVSRQGKWVWIPVCWSWRGWDSQSMMRVKKRTRQLLLLLHEVWVRDYGTIDVQKFLKHE